MPAAVSVNIESDVLFKLKMNNPALNKITTAVAAPAPTAESPPADTQPVTFSPTQDMPPYNADVPGQYGYVESENGNYVKDDQGNYVQVADGEGDYEYTFIPKMTSSIDAYGDQSVMDKTNNFLEWMQANPANTNGPEVFLLYLSELDQAGVFDDNPELAEYILSIEDGNGKTLVAMCVDITMLQMCMNGSTPDEARATIYALFPPPTDGPDTFEADPIGYTVRREADAECDAINASKTYDEDTGAYTYTLVPTSQLQLEEQWGAFITDPTTTKTMDEAQKNIRMDTLNMIAESSGDPYSALIAVIMWLMLLLSTQSTIRVNGYGDTLDWLGGVSEDLTEITTGWTNGFDVEGGDEWATYPDSTSENPHYVYVDDNGNYVSVNEENKWQVVDKNGNFLYTDSNGNVVYEENGMYYNESNGTLVANQDEDGYAVTPQMAEYNSNMGITPLTVNQKLAMDWVDEVEQVQAEVNDSPLLSQSTKDSFDQQCDIILNQQASTPVYEYQDKNGNPVSESGQAMDDDGYLLYQTTNKNGSVNTLYYNPEDGKYYVEGSNPPQENPGVDKGGDGTIRPVYYDNSGNLTKNQSNAAGGNHWEDTGESRNLYVNADGGSVDENGQWVNEDGDLLYLNGTIYKDSNGNYFYVADDTPVPYDVQKQAAASPSYGTDPTHSAEPLTISDQANGYTDANGNYHRADPTGLQESLDVFTKSSVPGSNMDGQAIGEGYGASAQNLAISNALSAMAKLITDQSSTITTQISQETNNIQLYLQTFSQLLIGDSGSYTSSVSKAVDGQIPR